jgi:hypothetical protein
MTFMGPDMQLGNRKLSHMYAGDASVIKI